jgi:hypothetical protein
LRALAFSRTLVRALAMRAVALWALIRVAVTIVFLLMSGGARPNPVAVILICAIVGMVDIRRRREAVLWKNLGVSTSQLVLIFAAAATIGESMIALVLR